MSTIWNHHGRTWPKSLQSLYHTVDDVTESLAHLARSLTESSARLR